MAFLNGANSFVSGEALSDNPYESGSGAKVWEAGWRYAEQSDQEEFSEWDYQDLEQLAKHLIEEKYDRPFFWFCLIYFVVVMYLAFYSDFSNNTSAVLFVSTLFPAFLYAWILSWLLNNRSVEVWLRLHKRREDKA